MENLQDFVMWSYIRQAWWKLMREHDCKCSNPCKKSIVILKSLQKSVSGKCLEILNGEYVCKEDIRELNFKGFYLLRIQFNKTKNFYFVLV